MVRPVLFAASDGFEKGGKGGGKGKGDRGGKGGERGGKGDRGGKGERGGKGDFNKHKQGLTFVKV